MAAYRLSNLYLVQMCYGTLVLLNTNLSYLLKQFLKNADEFVNTRKTVICTYLKQALDHNKFVDNGVVTCLFLLFSNWEMSSLFCKKLFIFAANNLEM
jgi:hypothetical protein